jgi:antitoxin VapB
MTTAKIIRDGERRILEIPRSFHLPGNEVFTRQSGNSLILEPLEDDWQWLKNLSRDADGPALDEMRAAADESVAVQERPEMDRLFK